MNYVKRIKDISEILKQPRRSRGDNKYYAPFVAVILTDGGFSPSIDHGGLGGILPYFKTLEEALAACEVEARRIAGADDALARTLGIETSP